MPVCHAHVRLSTEVSRVYWVWTSHVGAERQAGWEGQTLCELNQALKTGLVSQKMLVESIWEQGVYRGR